MAARTIRIAASCLTLIAAACSAQSAPGGSTLPGVANARIEAPLAKATPPVTAPVTIPYPYTNNWVTTTWKSATAKGVSTKGSDDGTTTVQFSIDKKTGVYLVPETIKSKTGYTEVLNSAITFPQFRGGTAQIILSDNYTYVQGPFSEIGLDTYPQGENSFDFPLTTGRTWSAAAAHNSSDNQTLSGTGAYTQNDASIVAANGEYTAQTQNSSTTGSANQDNYASTTRVSMKSPSVYTLSQPAAGYNKLTQSFALPKGKVVPVTSSGKAPIPYKAGTVNVPNWYPGGVIPTVLYADNYNVTGTKTMPSTCGKKWSGQSATAVSEYNTSLDLVQGIYNVNKTTYYLTSLAKGQYWFACIIDKYIDTIYANGWVRGAGTWGGVNSQQVGTEILIATGAKPAAANLAAIGRLHTLSFFTPRAARRIARIVDLGDNL